jgi:signal transduction histidine kinase
MTMIGILIVKFKTFNVTTLATNALIVGLVILIASQFTFATSFTGVVLTAVTLVLTGLLGTVLIRSVRKEIEQRKQIEDYAVQLTDANERLQELDRMKSEFVSIASHQLRSPLTSIRGYASMLAEGTYGKVPERAVIILQNIADSSRFMAQSVEDYLNVSRIEAGNMKYEYSDFSLKEQASKVVDELRQVAMKKGLVMVFRSDCTGSGMIHADIGKVRQVLMNLIDNSMKYTPKGSVTVVAHDDMKKKTITVSIHDTGIGMNAETVGEVFNKFVRAKNANCVNVTGTGLGLYVAKKMIDEMGGKVWAESEGEGKGSTFHLEFKVV